MFSHTHKSLPMLLHTPSNPNILLLSPPDLPIFLHRALVSLCLSVLNIGIYSLTCYFILPRCSTLPSTLLYTPPRSHTHTHSSKLSFILPHFQTLLCSPTPSHAPVHRCTPYSISYISQHSFTLHALSHICPVENAPPHSPTLFHAHTHCSKVTPTYSSNSLHTSVRAATRSAHRHTYIHPHAG